MQTPLLKKEKKLQAIKPLDEGRQDFPNDNILHFHLGRLYAHAVGDLGLNFDDKAEYHLLRAHELDENDCITLYELGRLYLKIGEHEKSEEAFFNAMFLNFDDSVTLYGLGLLYKKARGQLRDEKEELQLARACFGYAHEIADKHRGILKTSHELLMEVEHITRQSYSNKDIDFLRATFEMWVQETNDVPDHTTEATFE